MHFHHHFYWFFKWFISFNFRCAWNLVDEEFSSGYIETEDSFRLRKNSYFLGYLIKHTCIFSKNSFGSFDEIVFVEYSIVDNAFCWPMHHYRQMHFSTLEEIWKVLSWNAWSWKSFRLSWKVPSELRNQSNLHCSFPTSIPCFNLIETFPIPTVTFQLRLWLPI